MTVNLAGEDARKGHLLISENWYPDWHATVDGRPALVHRADHSLLSVDVPAGAKRVELRFNSRSYVRGKWLSAVSAAAALIMVGLGIVRDRRRRPTR
jgi:uncharacterized membrane protein YfhO